jgi:hypothetical protein
MMKRALVAMATTSLAFWALIGDAKAAITFTTPSKPGTSTVNVGTANQITTDAWGYGLSTSFGSFKNARVDLDWTGGGVTGIDVLLTAGQTLGLAWDYSGFTDLTYSPSTFIQRLGANHFYPEH